MEREEENLVPKKLDMVVKTVRFKDEDSKNAINILKSKKSIKVFHNNNNTITNLKTMTTTASPSKQNVLMATFGRKKEVKINKQTNNYTTAFVKDFKSLRSNDICKPVEKKCNTIPSSIKPMVSIPQAEVQRALKHSVNNKLSIKEEKPIDIPKLKICVPKPVKEEPIDTKMFRKLSIDERPVNESVDLETYVKKIGLQPIVKKQSPNTSPSSSSSSSASSVTSSFPFNNNESEHHHRHSLSSSSSSSSSHKKRKKSKHSKEPRDKDSKKRKIHAEISSNNENLKLKVKINHNHKNDRAVKIVEAPIFLAPAQLSRSTLEKLRCEPPPPPALPSPPATTKPMCPPTTTIKTKDTKLPISPPLPPSLFKTLPHTIQTVSATSTLPPPIPPMTVNRSNVKQITANSKEKFIMPSPPKTSAPSATSSSASPLKVNMITSIASEANRQASIKRSISMDETLESKQKIAKLMNEDGKQARRISFGSLTNKKPVNNKLCDDVMKSLTSNGKIPQPAVVSPTKATRPPPPTIPLLKIKRSLNLPSTPINNNNEPPGLISMKSMKGLGMTPANSTTSNKVTGKEAANNVLDLSRNNMKVDAKNCLEDALKKIRQNHNYSSVSSTSSTTDLKIIKPENKITIQSQRILPNLPKLNEISKIRPVNSSVRSIPNPSALIRNIQEVPALATIQPTPPVATNGKDIIKIEDAATNGKDSSEAVVSSSTISVPGSNSATDDEKKMKKNMSLEIIASNLTMRAAAAADSKVSPKGSNYIVSTSTSLVSSTETGSAKTTPSGNFSISSLVATAASPKSV